jgi:hypothetical protein
VDKVGDAAGAAADPQFLRLEDLAAGLRPPQVALEAAHAAIDRDDASSYLPFQGQPAPRLGHLERGGGTDPLRRPAARPSRRPPRPG